MRLEKETTLSKEIERYLRSVMLDKKADKKRRDAAAARLDKSLTLRRKVLIRKLRLKVIKASRAAAADARENPAPQAVKEVKPETPVAAKPKGKKEIRRANAQVVASTSDEWSDLIPRAQVVAISSAKRKA